MHNLVRRFVPLVLLWLVVLGSLAGCGGGGGSDDGGSAAVAQPPVASDGAVTTLEDSSVNATLNASDPSGLTLTFRVIANPGKGTVVINATAGSFAYTPNPNAIGGDSFTFVANNGGSDSNVATVTITITPVSDPPVAVNDAYTVPGPGQSLAISAPNCSDPDSNKRGVLCNDTDPDVPTTLTVATVDRGPRTLAHGSLTLNANGSFTYTHNGDTSTSDSFTYRANDGGLNSAPATVTLAINQPPAADNACVTTPINTPISGALSATDPEGQAVTFAVGAQGGKGTVNIDINGNYSYTPNNPNLRGMDKFTYEVTDSLDQSSTGTVTVLIDSDATPGRVRIMPLGDSITAGYLDSLTTEDFTEPFWVSYRRKLYNDLSALNPALFGIDFVGTITNLGASANPPLADRDNEGHDGWRDDEILNGADPGKQDPACPTCNITDWLNSTRPDIVLLHIGTNGINDSGGTSSADVAAILDKIQAWETANSSPVTVMLARIIGSPNATTNANVTTFNNNVAAMAQTRIDNGDKIVIVNQQTGAGLTYQLGAADGSPSGPDMGNNLHPNQDGYDKMADKWKADMLTSGVLPSCP